MQILSRRKQSVDRGVNPVLYNKREQKKITNTISCNSFQSVKCNSEKTVDSAVFFVMGRWEQKRRTGEKNSKPFTILRHGGGRGKHTSKASAVCARTVRTKALSERETVCIM